MTEGPRQHEQHPRDRPDPRVQIRLVVIQILVFSLLLTLGGRLWYLQIRNGKEYTDEAKNNHVQQVVQPAVRGSLLDARGVPLADNETRLVVSASRTELMKMKDKGRTVLTRLAGVLDMKPEDVVNKVRLCDSQTPKPCWNGSPYQPIPVTDEATTQQALQIRERAEDFPGITAEPTAVRRYPAPGKARTSQVLGYLSPVTDAEIEKAKDTDSPFLRSDQIGRSGLERTYDKALRGKAGVTRYEVDNLGRVIGQAKNDPPVLGSNVVTSIDARVQAVAEWELHNAMVEARKTFDKNTNENYKADAGAVVVMENKTGRIVAMASQPDYDPNAWVGGISAKDYAALTGKNSNFPLLNRAIQGQAAPGSIFKVIPTTAAVNAGYDFNGRYPCPSSYSIGNQVFKNFESQATAPSPSARPSRSPATPSTTPLPPAVAEGRRHEAEEGRQGLVLQDRPPVRSRRRDRHRPPQRGHRPRPRPQVEAGLLGGQQGLLVQDRQEGRHLRPAALLRELPRRQPDARR